MTALLFALAGSFLAAFGGRGQMLVARLADRLGASAGLLFVGLATSVVSAAVAAAVGAWLGPQLSPSAARLFLAIALVLASLSLVLPVRPDRLEEPTRSLGAIALVLLARQMADVARLLICLIAAVFASAPMAVFGGAIGGGAALTLGWWLGARLDADLPLTPMRRMVAGLMLVAAVAVALNE